MKRIALALCIPVLLSAPVYAEDLCQEEAKAMGYVGPTDTLKPCNPQENASKEVYSGQVAKAREQKEVTQKQDADALEQFGQAQLQ